MYLLKLISKPVLLLSILFLAACGGDDNGFPSGACGGAHNPCAAYAVALTVTPKLNTLAVNTGAQYRAVATFSDASEIDVTAAVVWSSSALAVATISETGLASALTAGATQLTASYLPEQIGAEALTDTAKLSVTDAALVALTIEPGQAQILVGMSQEFNAIALFADSHIQDVTEFSSWSVSESSIAAISSSSEQRGVATGIAVGTSMVSASFNTLSASAQLIVLGATPQALIISPVELVIATGTSAQYRADLLLDNGSSLDVTGQSVWQSSTANIASIDSEALLQALEVGVTQVSATLSFGQQVLSATTSATVIVPQLIELVVSPAKVSLPVGTQGDYTALAYYSDTSVEDVSRDVIWRSDNELVVSIDAAGENAGHAVALAAGEVTVTASFGALTADAVAEVTNAVIESIEIAPINAVTPAGTSVTYSARARFSDTSVHDITLLGYWQSTDLSIATIGLTGALAGKAQTLMAGETEISIEYMGMTQMTKLTVTSAVLTQLQLTPKDLKQPIGTQGQYHAMAYYSDNHSVDVTQDATWRSADASIVSIVTSGANAGYAQAMGLGQTAILVSYAGFTATSGGAISEFESRTAYGHKTALEAELQRTSQRAGIVQDNTSATVTDAVLEQLIISPVIATVAAGNSQQYNLTGVFSDDTSKDLTELAFWQVSNSDVAHIDRKGNALSITPGSTKILARYLHQRVEAELIVTEAVIQALQVTPAQNQLPVGHELQLSATAFYSDGHSSDVTQLASWSSLDTSVAEVVAAGVDAGRVHGLEVGETQVIASYTGFAGEANVNVTDAVLESVNLSPRLSSVAAGNTQQYQLIALFSDGTNKNLTKLASWQSSAGQVASIDRLGLAQSYAKGQTQITASFIGFSAKAVLNVSDAELLSLQVTPAQASVPIGTQGQYQATAFYSDNHSEDVTALATWSASEPEYISIVATGADAGQAYAKAVGHSEVQANFDGMVQVASIDVTDVILVEYIITPEDAEIPVGLELAYHAYGRYSDGSTKNLTLQSSWQSGNLQVATINRRGIALGLYASPTQIKASYIGFSAQTPLLVTEPILIEIQVSPPTSKVNINETQQYTARAFYSDGYSGEITSGVTWSVGDDTIAHVTASGLAAGIVSGVTHGITSVKAVRGDLSDSAEVVVTQLEYLGIEVEPADSRLRVNDTRQMQAMAVYLDENGNRIKKDVADLSYWSVGNRQVLTVSQTGLATGVAVGGSAIYANYQNKRGEGGITVVDTYVSQIIVTPKNLDVPVDAKGRYKAIAIYGNGLQDADVTDKATWSSLNTDVIHIIPTGANGGTGTARAVGGSTIAAEFEGVSGSVLTKVVDLDLIDFKVTPQDDYIASGLELQLTATAYYSNDSSRNVTQDSFWKSASPKAISVKTGTANAGLAKALVTDGSSKITASYQGFEDTTKLTIMPPFAVSIKITPLDPHVAVNEYNNLKGTVVMSDGSEYDLTGDIKWLEEDGGIAMAFNNGLVKGLAAGTTVIYADWYGTKGEVVLTVTP